MPRLQGGDAGMVDIETDNGTVLPELDSQRQTHIAQPNHSQLDITKIHEHIHFKALKIFGVIVTPDH
jgi:hypothetical protein